MGKKKELKVDPELLEKLNKIIVDNTDEAFYVKVDSDDCSSHISCYADRKEDGSSSWKSLLPTPLDGWRIITIDVPNGYIDTFKNKS